MSAERPSPVISPEEFARWLTPQQAFAVLRVQWDNYEAYEAVTRLLKHDLLVAVAQTTAIARFGKDLRKLAYHTIPDDAWKRDRCPSYNSTFWKTGQFENRADSHGAVAFTYFGVRFDPDGIRGQLEGPAMPEATPSPAQPASEPDERASRLTDGMLKDWERVFRKAYPNGSKQLAEKSAYGMFPRHQIGRQRVRDLFPDARPGRPLKDNEK